MNYFLFTFLHAIQNYRPESILIFKATCTPYAFLLKYGAMDFYTSLFSRSMIILRSNFPFHEPSTNFNLLFILIYYDEYAFAHFFRASDDDPCGISPYEEWGWNFHLSCCPCYKFIKNEEGWNTQTKFIVGYVVRFAEKKYHIHYSSVLYTQG